MEPAGLGIERGHGAGAVDADQPIRFRTAHGRIGQRTHGEIVTQRGKALADGGWGHGLQPEPLDGLFGLRKLNEVTENQFAFPSGVASIDQVINVLAFEQLGQQFEAVLRFFDWPQVESGRDYGKVGEAPLPPFHFVLLRHAQLQQVPHRGGEDILFTLKITFVLAEAAQGLGDIAGHRGLLSND